jgi:hypothetical protein
MRKKGIDLESVSERFQRSQLLVFSMVVGLSKERFLNLGPGPLSKVSRSQTNSDHIVENMARALIQPG